MELPLRLEEASGVPGGGTLEEGQNVYQASEPLCLALVFRVMSSALVLKARGRGCFTQMFRSLKNVVLCLSSRNFRELKEAL